MKVVAFVVPLALVTVLLSGCGGGTTPTVAPTVAPTITPFPHRQSTTPGVATTRADPTTNPAVATTTTTPLPSCSGGQPGGPGGFVSVSESVLNRGADRIVTNIVNDLRSFVIKGQNTLAIDFDDLRFEELTVGSSEVAVKASEGVEVSLQDMSNKIAHVPFCAHDPLRLLKCCGTLWGTATGQSYRAMNTIVVDETTGWGQLVTTTAPGGFTAGDIQVHHQMNGAVCELSADVLGLINGVIIALVSKALELELPKIVAKVVDTPVNLILYGLENPPALGFGEEKFKLDNSFVDVDYSDHRITHYHKAEFKSTVNPIESTQVPCPLTVSSDRDIALGFSDYVLNTLFEALYTEHMFEHEINLPFLHTPEHFFLCSDCPVVVNVTFKQRAEAQFMGDRAANILRDMTFDLGVRVNPSDPLGVVAPIVTLAVDATASMEFELQQPEGKLPDLKATLHLESFKQKLVASFIGDIDISELSLGIKAVLNNLLDKLNNAIPGLPLPAFAGVKLSNPSFVVDNHQLVVLADLVQAGFVSRIMV